MFILTGLLFLAGSAVFYFVGKRYRRHIYALQDIGTKTTATIIDFALSDNISMDDHPTQTEYPIIRFTDLDGKSIEQELNYTNTFYEKGKVMDIIYHKEEDDDEYYHIMANDWANKKLFHTIMFVFAGLFGIVGLGIILIPIIIAYLVLK